MNRISCLFHAVATLALAAAALPQTAHARKTGIALWRGETATKILHDYAKVGEAPENCGDRPQESLTLPELHE